LEPTTDPVPTGLQDAPTVAPLLVSRLAARDDSETPPAPRRAQDTVAPAVPTPNSPLTREHVENDTTLITPTPQPDHIPQAVLTLRVTEQKETSFSAPRSGGRDNAVQVAIRPPVSAAPATPTLATNVLTPKPVHVQPLPARQRAAGEASRIAAPPTAGPEPVINVTIGVVEVRATEKISAPAQPRIDRNRRAPMSLEEYLKQRRG
jgi:hypothetical protein